MVVLLEHAIQSAFIMCALALWVHCCLSIYSSYVKEMTLGTQTIISFGGCIRLFAVDRLPSNIFVVNGKHCYAISVQVSSACYHGFCYYRVIH